MPDTRGTEFTEVNAQVEDDQSDESSGDACGLLFAISVSLFSILFYVAAIGFILWVIAMMLGLVE